MFFSYTESGAVLSSRTNFDALNSYLAEQRIIHFFCFSLQSLVNKYEFEFNEIGLLPPYPSQRPPIDFSLCHREAEEGGKVSVHRVLPIFQENELILSVSDVLFLLEYP